MYRNVASNSGYITLSYYCLNLSSENTPTVLGHSTTIQGKNSFEFFLLPWKDRMIYTNVERMDQTNHFFSDFFQKLKSHLGWKSTASGSSAMPLPSFNHSIPAL